MGIGLFTRTARWLRVALLALAAWAGLAAVPGVQAARPRDVFVVHSYSQEYPWTRRQHEGFLAGLAADAGHAYEVRAEYLDTKRVPYDAAYAQRVADHLAEKYRGYAPDAVYVSDDNALVFALEHLQRLFPNAPVVFSGVNDVSVRARLDPDRVTGVFERKEIGPNLELMRLVAPDASDVVVVGDASETYRAIEREIRAQLAAYPGVRVRFVAERRLDALLAGVQAGHERFLFLTTLGALTGADGTPLTLRESIAAITAPGRHAVVSMEDVYLLPGVLGGYVTSGTAQGRAAAQLVVQHLAGQPLRDLPPIEASPNEYLFDAHELQRWGIALPPAIAARATVLRPLPSLVQRYQHEIVLVLYALAGTLVLSLAVSLVVVLRKNRQIRAHAAALQAQAARMAEAQDRLVRAQRIAGLGHWDWRIAENRLEWSPEIYRIFGVDPERFAPGYEAFLERVHADDRARVDAAVRRALATGEPYDLTHRVVLPGGGLRVVRENAEVLFDGEGRPLRMIGTVMDVTERERTLHALHRSEETLRRVVEELPVVLWMLDADGRFVLSEGKGLEALGRRPGEVVGQSVFELYRGFPDVVADTRRVLAGEAFACTWQIGQLVFETHYSPLRDAAGGVNGAIGVAIDVTERKRNEDRLAYLANFDPVTGLPNRSLFRDRLAHALHTADRQQQRVALLFVDLDNFKHVNDSLGHAAGDELLRQVGARLRAAVRISDTVCRLGGDEFTVIAEGLTRDEDAVHVAAKVLEQSSRPYRLGEREVYVTASVGIALYPRDGDSADALLMNADAAMYRAKENGRCGYEFFTQAISARAQQRLELGNELRGALARGEFAVHYQPKVAIDGGEVIGFEALLRWRNARLGPVSPAVFIPILEETGLIVEVGEWVLAEACRWAARLPATGASAPGVSVNLSARQFRHPHLDDVVQRALAATGLDPARLELEITESILVDRQADLQTMQRLKSLGVGLSIDDFGTGYSSLSYLKRFPVDRLKVDASFVRDVADDPDDAAIVAAIVGLAHHLQLRVIAEGVETAEQLGFLRRHGCDEVQGYLFARPMPGDEARAWLAARSSREAHEEPEATPLPLAHDA
ncbi:EAL domain-containing protein [Azohydromonas sediminis]|uniref:EAL domain-containing protein n=1 Tax=Azohydromonas sediminis TaxID=2259674 RepID=UPI000E646ECE|nr:EAL domain-containing protein [Azohydromonas sediminis]